MTTLVRRTIGAALAAVLAGSLWLAGSVAPQTAMAQTPPPAPAASDALKVILCGTAGPLPVRDRAKPCVAVQAGGKLYLVDVGGGSTQNLQLWRVPLATVGAVFITHLHSDHIGDMGEFNMQSWVAGRPHALQVIGPPGVDRLAAGFNEAYGPDHGFRRAHHEHDGIKLPIADGLLVAKVVRLPTVKDPAMPRTALVLKEGDLTVTAIAVNHAPADPAYGYRFDYRGRSVVISGDTKYWPPLAVAAKGADVLIHEAQNRDMNLAVVAALKGAGQARMASIMNDTRSYHSTPVEAAQIAKAAGVKALVLTHLTQAGLPFFTPEAFVKGVDAVGFADWRLAKDGMTITLPVGSGEIVWGQF